MIKLLMIADDFSGALDAGVQFAARGAATRVVTDLDCDFLETDAEVLVMVAETPPSLTEPLIGDILRALAVTPDQVLQLTPERVAMLPQDSRCNSWLLGTEASLPLAGAQVSTPAFDELQTSAPARRALWQQICAHEHDFYPQHG